MEFTNKKRQLEELIVVPSLLFEILGVLYRQVSVKYKKNIKITRIYSSEEEQKALCVKMNRIPYASPHTYYRAIDLIIPGATPKEYKEIELFINDKYVYGGKYQTCIYHKGTGWHIHIQVPPNSI